ncbi:MAG: MBL fold metallo-hydrolase [Gammaproteobacteria bacterium]|nr:MBL fold metallo-hydrolase [Gammaproteobacteria bacterium]
MALAQAAPAKILPPPQKISAHVYAWIGPYGGASKENHGFRMNLAFVVGAHAVAVIDTGYTEAMAKEMLDAIRSITPLPVKYAINTNSQPHRYLGNAVFRRAGAKIIAHRAEAARMARLGSDQTQAVITTLELPAGSVQPPAPPDQLLDGDLTLDLGQLELHIISVGAAHTPAQLAVNIAADKVVYAGDVLFSGRLLAILPDGNVKSWLKAYGTLAAFGDATFIPGHGQPGKLKAFDSPTRDYLQLLYGHMGKKIEAGADIQEAIGSLDQSYFKTLADFDALAGRNASWAYLEREAEFFSK